jgi:hypothetical protein
LANELIQMVLQDAVQIHNIAAAVIDHLHLARRLFKKHPRCARENLAVTGMLWD